MTQQIGILFWGCKGGHRNFCDNGVVDVYSTEIRQTYKDVRSFATFSVVNTDFYALEFTPKYKVYTHYRSSNDSGSGAFIAVSIYVPNSLQVRDIRQIMDKMMDEYFEQYFNPITNSPIPGMMDDIAPFQLMFDDFAQSHVLPDQSRFFKRPSRQDDTPKVFAYSSVDELDAFFASPYRPEFFDCQEVMFISREILQNQSQYGLRFQVTPTIIEHVSEPEPEPFIGLFPQSKDFRLTQLVVNGVDYTQRQGDVPLYPGDRISILIEGGRYQRPITVDNATLEEVVQAGLIRKVGRGYEFLPVYNLDYALFNVQAKLEGDDTGTYYQNYALRSLESPNLIIAGTQYDPRSGMFVFSVSGRYLDHHFQLIYSLVPGSTNPTLVIPMNQVDVETLVSQQLTLQLSLQRHLFSFVYADTTPKAIQFKITTSDKTKSISGNIVDPGAKAELCLPSDFTFTDEDVLFEALDYVIKLDSRGRYIVTPQWIDVEVVMPRYLANKDMTALIPSFHIGDQIYKGFWQTQNCYIRLPYDWTDLEGKLFLSGNSFPYEKVSRSKISFKCAVVCNRSERPLSYEVIFEDHHQETRKLRPNNLDIFPSTVDIRISPEFREVATVDEKGYATDNQTKLFLLVPRQLQQPESAAASSNLGFDIDDLSGESDPAQGTDTAVQHPSASTQRRLTKTSDVVDETTETDEDQQQERQQRPRPGEFTRPRNQVRSNGTHNRGNGNRTASTTSSTGSATNATNAANAANATSATSAANATDASNLGTGQNAQSTTTTSNHSVPETPSYYIKLINCGSLNARLLLKDNSYRVVPIANLDTTDYITVNPDRAQVKLLDSREREVCVVNFPLSDYRRDTVMAERNAENGFDVNWVDDNHCMVYYKKSNIFSKLLNTLNANKKLLVGVISILLIALVTALWMFISRTSEDYNLDLRFAVNPNPTDTLVSKITHVGYKDVEYYGDSLVISNNGDILNLRSAANPTVLPSTGGVVSDLYVVYNSNHLVPILKDNVYTDTAYTAVIFPEDIRITVMGKSGATATAAASTGAAMTASQNTEGTASTASATALIGKEWTMDSLFKLMADPKLIKHNIALELHLPPLGLLNAYQELRRLPQVDQQLIDSLIRVYPGYESTIIRLKEPQVNADEANNAEKVEDNKDAKDGQETKKANEVTTNPANGTAETVTPADGGANKAEGNNKAVKDNQSQSQTNPATPATPTTPDPAQAQKNQVIVKEYNAKLAKLDGVFDKAMVEDLVNFQKQNKEVLKEEIKKNKIKVFTYDNFVHGREYNISNLSPEQQKVIDAVKEINPALVAKRDYPAIYKAYHDAGGL